MVGDFRDIAQRHQRHRVDSDTFADIYDAHHPVLVGHPREGAGGGREVQRVRENDKLCRRACSINL